MDGAELRAIRMEQGWSQVELARRCGFANQTLVSRIESGTVEVPADLAKRVRQALATAKSESSAGTCVESKKTKRARGPAARRLAIHERAAALEVELGLLSGMAESTARLEAEFLEPAVALLARLDGLDAGHPVASRKAAGVEALLDLGDTASKLAALVGALSKASTDSRIAYETLKMVASAAPAIADIATFVGGPAGRIRVLGLGAAHGVVRAVPVALPIMIGALAGVLAIRKHMAEQEVLAAQEQHLDRMERQIAAVGAFPAQVTLLAGQCASRGRRELDWLSSMLAAHESDPAERVPWMKLNEADRRRIGVLIEFLALCLRLLDLPFVAADDNGSTEAESVAEANRRVIEHTSEWLMEHT